MGMLGFVVPEAEAAAGVDWTAAVTAATDYLAEQVQNEVAPVPKVHMMLSKLRKLSTYNRIHIWYNLHTS